MKTKNKEKLVVLDLETTGVSTGSARIVEMCMYFPGTEKIYSILINPEISIPEGATGVHGITNEMVKDCPTFKDLSIRLAKQLKGVTVIGYNSKAYDVPLLQNEFKRCNIEWEPVNQIDAYTIWTQQEKTKKLGDAYKRFCNKDLEGAHRAENDVMATFKIFQVQESLWGYDTLVEATNKTPEPKKEKEITNIFNFGKYRTQTVEEVIKIDNNYIQWCLKQDFVNEKFKKIIYSVLENK